MSRICHRLFLSTSALVSLSILIGVAQAQTVELPEITVNAPRPAPAEAPLQGSLPIVTDQYSTVTVVPREELQRAPASTLGDVLFNKPGVTGSSFAPGASSRPIVRGLDGNRVGIVDNGVGSGGVSELGEDHFVPVNPLASTHVEVIRGPATLRYGSQAIGGVVTSTNNRIPEKPPCEPADIMRMPRGCTSLELRGALSSVDNGREGGVLFDAGGNSFALHVDGFWRRTEDYRVPSYPYLTPPDPVALPGATQRGGFNGRQPNSWTHSNEFSVGGSYLFFGGFAGMAFTQNRAQYAIPGADGEGTNTRISSLQNKIMGKGEFRSASNTIDAIRFWWGYTDYAHREIGLADPADFASDGIRQIFTNKELEGRVEVQFLPLKLNVAEMTTSVGAQASHQKLTAPSPDDPGSVLNGLFDPNQNTRVAGYIFNEFKFSNTTKAQIAGRIESVSLSGAQLMFPGTNPIFDVGAAPGSLGVPLARDLNFTPKSLSVGLIQNFAWDLVGSFTAQYVERAPKPAELFSRGAHDATATFDIGNPDLSLEKAKSVELALRRAKGPFRLEITGYYTRFDGFIFRRLTGNTCDESSCIAGAGLELNQAVYSQSDATFRGGEFQFQWDLVPMWRGYWGVEGQYDIVRATFADGSNVPRIPPQRLGGGVYFRNAEWFGRINLLHAFAQNDIAPVGETPTAGYDLLRAEVSYTRTLKNDPSGMKQFTVGIVGNNLLNQDIRNHVSYTKDFVLMPGASARLFASVRY
jgi:iron complex outermembrane receptor protein